MNTNECPLAAAPMRNRLLATLPASDLQRALPRFERVPLTLKSIVQTQGQPVAWLYFPENGAVSMITRLADGAQIEVGLVGPEGFVGLPLLLGAPTAPVEGMVQIEGSALRLSAANYHALVAEMPRFQLLLLRSVDTFSVQVMRTAACNSRHHIAQRLARWLLMSHDRVEGDIFPMTHDFIATLLGVRRPGVTLAIGALQRAGLIAHKKRVVRVLDRLGLEQAACECYAAIRERHEWMADAVGR